MSQYKLGTVTVANGSLTVTGQGTAWAGAITAGDLLLIGPGDPVAVVASVQSATSLTLEGAGWQGPTYATPTAYALHRDFEPRTGAPLLSPGDINTVAVFNRAVVALANAGAGAATPTPTVVSLGTLTGAVTVDCSVSRAFTATLGAATVTITPTTAGVAATAFLRVVMRLTQDASGSRALGQTATVTWAGSGYVPGLNAAAGAMADVEYISTNGGQSWVASLIQQTAGTAAATTTAG